MITKEEFQDWKDHPVTEAFMDCINDKVDVILEKLATNTPEEIPDDWFKGYYGALKDVLGFSMEDA